MVTKNHPFSAMPKVILICAVLIHVSVLKSSQAQVNTRQQEQPLTIEETVWQENLQGIEPISSQTIKSFAATIVQKSSKASATKDSDNDDETGFARSTCISPRKSPKRPLSCGNATGELYKLLQQEAKFNNKLAKIKEKNETPYELNLDLANFSVSQSQQIMQLELQGSLLQISPLLHYLVLLSSDRTQLYIYPWDSIHEGHYCYSSYSSKERIISCDFFLNDTYLQLCFSNGTKVIYKLKDTQRRVAIEQEKQETQTMVEYLNKVEYTDQQLSQALSQELLSAPKEQVPEKFSRMITDCSRFYWNSCKQICDKQYSFFKKGYCTYWICHEDTQDFLNQLEEEGYSKSPFYEVFIFTKTTPTTVKLHIPKVGILSQIDNCDIQTCNVLIGNPLVICFYTADKNCHVAILKAQTFIPVISGVTAVERGPKDYLVVCKNDTWYIIKLDLIAIKPASTPPSPASSTSVSEQNSPELQSETPSPSTSQAHLATITPTPQNSPVTKVTPTPTTSSTATSQSTSSVTVTTASATSTSPSEQEYSGDTLYQSLCNWMQ